MKPIDRQSLDEQARLVSRYVAGDLSRSERADFEAWLEAGGASALIGHDFAALDATLGAEARAGAKRPVR